MKVKSYRDLLVWQKSMDLMVECYRLADRLPRTEVYGLTSEIHRSALHVPSYIADGHGRDYTHEYLQRLSAAYGALMMLETQLLAMDRLNFLSMNEIEPLLERTAEVGKMLNGLIRSLKSGQP